MTSAAGTEFLAVDAMICEACSDVIGLKQATATWRRQFEVPASVAARVFEAIKSKATLKPFTRKCPLSGVRARGSRYHELRNAAVVSLTDLGSNLA